LYQNIMGKEKDMTKYITMSKGIIRLQTYKEQEKNESSKSKGSLLITRI